MLKNYLTTVLALLLIVTSVNAGVSSTVPDNAKEIVRGFVNDIRSGKNLDKANDYMATEILAHQVWAEGGKTVRRSPENYIAHIEEFIEAFGPFEVILEEIIAEGDRVYVRWRQEGYHNVSLEGEDPTGTSLVEVTSTVYRVENGKIVEYWLQTDRQGMSNQLKKSD